jgi:hypothetical protein
VPIRSNGPGRAFVQAEGINLSMRIILQKYVWVAAVAAGIAISGGAVQIAASPYFDEHEQDYSKNKTYQQGVREGQDDHAHNKDHSKKRHFKKDDDQKAYEAGYQKGRN